MSNICKNWTQWLLETRFAGETEKMREETIAWLDSVGNAVVKIAQIQPTDTVLDIGTGTGLLAFKALEILENYGGQGKIIFSDKFADCLEACKGFIGKNEIKTPCEFLNAACEDLKLQDNSIDKAMMRSVLVHIPDKQPAINEIYRVLKPGGYFCAFEPIIRSNTRCWELTDSNFIENYYEFKDAENKIMSDGTDSLCNFDDLTLKANLENAGFSDSSTMVHAIKSNYVVTKEMVLPWFTNPPSPDRPTMKQRYLQFFEENKVDKFIEDVQNYLEGREIHLSTNSVLIYAIK